MSFEHRTLYASHSVTFGSFQCSPSHPHFALPNRSRGSLLVFPRTSVEIVRDRGDGFIADSNQAVYYPPEQEYYRREVQPEGERCDWFAFPEAAFATARQRIGPLAAGDEPRFRSILLAPISPATFMMQRRVVRHVLARGEQANRAWVEDSLSCILKCTLEAALLQCSSRRRVASASTEREHQELVRETQRILGVRFRERLSVERLAAEVGCSPFHLSRIFRRNIGVSIHRYLMQLRLRAAVESLEDPARNLTELARELGFSSHSHFTYSFRQHFDLTPSQWQRQTRQTRTSSGSRAVSR